MSIKKKIAFVTRDLSGGGVENTLLNLINALDKDIVEISLVLFDEEGSFKSRIPKNIKVYSLYDETLIGARINYNSKKRCKELLRSGRFLSAFKLFCIERNSLRLARKEDIVGLYKYYLKHLPMRLEDYDVVVDFHGYGDFTSYYAINKIRAKKYVTWLHDEHQDWLEDCRELYEKYDKVFACSLTCRQRFIEFFPCFEKKCDVFYNILPVESILSLAAQGKPEEFSDENGLKFLTVGRMTEQKGFDIAIDAALILKKRNIEFKWYFIGEGKNKEIYQNMAVEKGLTDNIVFLGFRQNPYIYMQNCDIYIQPSRHEGYCTTISEAKIIGAVICATNVSGVSEQIRNHVTGVITQIDSDDIAHNVQLLIQNKTLYNKIRTNVAANRTSFHEELNKLYNIINQC